MKGFLQCAEFPAMTEIICNTTVQFKLCNPMYYILKNVNYAGIWSLLLQLLRRYEMALFKLWNKNHVHLCDSYLSLFPFMTVFAHSFIVEFVISPSNVNQPCYFNHFRKTIVTATKITLDFSQKIAFDQIVLDDGLMVSTWKGFRINWSL